MGITTAILIGAATFAAYFGATSYAIDKKIKYYDIVVDATNKEVRISCNARGISENNFKVYTRLENKKIYLYTKGAEVLEGSKDVVSVEHKYCLTNIDPDDVCKMTWMRNQEDRLVVTIPLSTVNKNISIKRIK